MNRKMTTKSQLLTTEPKTEQKQKQTKQTSRTGTKSQKWRSHRGLSVGEKVQRISSIHSRWKTDRVRLRIVQEM